MDIKLTLKLDSQVINRAKAYAEEKQISLSKLIEGYLDALTSTQQVNEDVTPFVKSLSGSLKLPKNADYKKMYRDHLLKKYGK